MATENVEAGAASGGSRFASDTETVGTLTVNHPLTKIEWGAEDTFTLVSTGTASLPVQGAATENAAVAGNPVLAGGRFDLSARTLGNGDAGAIALDASGYQIVSGTLTANLGATDNAVLDSIDSAVNGTLTVGSHAVTNAGTFAVQVDGAALTALQLIDDAVYTDATGTPSKGLAVMGTDGTNPQIVSTNTSGHVNIADGGNAITVDGTVTVGGSLPAGTNAIGKLSANSGVDIGDVDVTSISAGSNLIGDVGISGARTSGGTTLYRNVDVDETEDAIKATAGQLYWLHAMNLTASVVYLQLYNATVASVTVGTTTPDLTFPIPTQGDTNGAGFVLAIPNGIAFGTAITIACTTTIGGAAGPAANGCVVNAGYA